MGGRAEAAVPELVKGLQDDDAEVVRAALRTLGVVGPKAAPAVPRLMEMYKDPKLNEQTRPLVLFALAGIGPGAKAAVPLLTDVLKDRAANENTRIDCMDAALSAGCEAGTASAPASAPMAAASAQPSMSMLPTGIPSSELDSGFDATARTARPSFVRLSNR